jgi:hypothetical protein
VPLSPLLPHNLLCTDWYGLASGKPSRFMLIVTADIDDISDISKPPKDIAGKF